MQTTELNFSTLSRLEQAKSVYLSHMPFTHVNDNPSVVLDLFRLIKPRAPSLKKLNPADRAGPNQELKIHFGSA